MTEISIPRKRSAHYRIIISSSVALFLSIQWLADSWRGVDEWSSNNLLILAFMVLCTIFLINAILQILKRSPALTINDKGIYDNIGNPIMGLVVWENVVNCEIRKFAGAPHLVIGLKDYSDLIKKYNGFKKKLLETKVKDLGTPVVLNLNLIDIDNGDLNRMIEEKLFEFIANNQRKLESE